MGRLNKFLHRTWVSSGRSGKSYFLSYNSMSGRMKLNLLLVWGFFFTAERKCVILSFFSRSRGELYSAEASLSYVVHEMGYQFWFFGYCIPLLWRRRLPSSSASAVWRAPLFRYVKLGHENRFSIESSSSKRLANVLSTYEDLRSWDSIDPKVERTKLLLSSLDSRKYSFRKCLTLDALLRYVPNAIASCQTTTS